MNQVLCPNCGTVLHSYNKYFCSKCGTKLVTPKETVTYNKPVVDIVIKQDRAWIQHSYYIYLLVFTILIAVVLFFYAKDITNLVTFNKKLEKAEVITKTSPLPKEVVYVDTMLTMARLDKNKIAKYAAFDASFYAEAFDAKKVLDLYLSSKSPKYSAELSSLYPFVNGHIMIFGQDNYWTILAEKASVDSAASLDMGDLTFGDIDNFYFISTNPNAYKELLYAKEKVIKNFGMHPTYITTSHSLGEHQIKGFSYMQSKESYNEFLQSIGFNNTKVLETLQNNSYNYFVVL